MNTPSAIDACLCPLCGRPNQCAMAQATSGQAAGQPAGQQAPCWCTREEFGAALLERVPEAARDKACICQACVQAARAQP